MTEFSLLHIIYLSTVPMLMPESGHAPGVTRKGGWIYPPFLQGAWNCLGMIKQPFFNFFVLNYIKLTNIYIMNNRQGIFS